MSLVASDRAPGRIAGATWAALAALLTLACLWLPASGLSVGIDRPLITTVVLCGSTWLLSVCCRRYATNDGLAASFEGIAQLTATSLILAFLQYPAAKVGHALTDWDLASADRMLGFDWPGHFRAVLAHPWIEAFFSKVYLSILSQGAVLCLLVGLRDPDRLRICVAANAMVAAIGLAIFVVAPAAGAFGYYAPEGITSSYLNEFIAARAGGVAAVRLGTVQGIIQFPSLHASTAVILAYGFLALPRWAAVPMLLIEAILAISALSMGGHHLADVIAGALLAAGALIALRSVRTLGSTERAALYQHPAESAWEHRAPSHRDALGPPVS
jgi:membrane-associated phospholipid phosphatase